MPIPLLVIFTCGVGVSPADKLMKRNTIKRSKVVGGLGIAVTHPTNFCFNVATVKSTGLFLAASADADKSPPGAIVPRDYRLPQPALDREPQFYQRPESYSVGGQ